MEQIKNYHFNNFIDDELRIKILNFVKTNNLNENKLYSFIDDEFKNNEAVIQNPSAYITTVIKGIRIRDFKIQPAILPSWILGEEYFVGFSGEEIDRYLFARIIEYVINTGQKDSCDWVIPMLKEMDLYCKENNVSNWKDLLNLLITSNEMEKCRFPIETLRKEEEAKLKEFGELLAEFECAKNTRTTL